MRLRRLARFGGDSVGHAVVNPACRTNGHRRVGDDDLRVWVSEARSTIPAVAHVAHVAHVARVDCPARLQGVSAAESPRRHEIRDGFERQPACDDVTDWRDELVLD